MMDSSAGFTEVYKTSIRRLFEEFPESVRKLEFLKNNRFFSRILDCIKLSGSLDFSANSSQQAPIVDVLLEFDSSGLPEEYKSRFSILFEEDCKTLSQLIKIRSLTIELTKLSLNHLFDMVPFCLESGNQGELFLEIINCFEVSGKFKFSSSLIKQTLSYDTHLSSILHSLELQFNSQRLPKQFTESINVIPTDECDTVMPFLKKPSFVLEFKKVTLSKILELIPKSAIGTKLNFLTENTTLKYLIDCFKVSGRLDFTSILVPKNCSTGLQTDTEGETLRLPFLESMDIEFDPSDSPNNKFKDVIKIVLEDDCKTLANLFKNCCFIVSLDKLSLEHLTALLPTCIGSLGWLMNPDSFLMKIVSCFMVSGTFKFSSLEMKKAAEVSDCSLSSLLNDLRFFVDLEKLPDDLKQIISDITFDKGHDTVSQLIQHHSFSVKLNRLSLKDLITTISNPILGQNFDFWKNSKFFGRFINCFKISGSLNFSSLLSRKIQNQKENLDVFDPSLFDSLELELDPSELPCELKDIITLTLDNACKKLSTFLNSLAFMVEVKNVSLASLTEIIPSFLGHLQFQKGGQESIFTKLLHCFKLSGSFRFSPALLSDAPPTETNVDTSLKDINKNVSSIFEDINLSFDSKTVPLEWKNIIDIKFHDDKKLSHLITTYAFTIEINNLSLNNITSLNFPVEHDGILDFLQEKKDTMIMKLINCFKVSGKFDFSSLRNTKEVSGGTSNAKLGLDCLNVKFDPIDLPKELKSFMEISFGEECKVSQFLNKFSFEIELIKMSLKNFFELFPFCEECLGMFKNNILWEIVNCFKLSGKFSFSRSLLDGKTSEARSFFTDLQLEFASQDLPGEWKHFLQIRCDVNNLSQFFETMAFTIDFKKATLIHLDKVLSSCGLKFSFFDDPNAFITKLIQCISLSGSFSFSKNTQSSAAALDNFEVDIDIASILPDLGRYLKIKLGDDKKLSNFLKTPKISIELISLPLGQLPQIFENLCQETMDLSCLTKIHFLNRFLDSFKLSGKFCLPRLDNSEDILGGVSLRIELQGYEDKLQISLGSEGVLSKFLKNPSATFTLHFFTLRDFLGIIGDNLIKLDMLTKNSGLTKIFEFIKLSGSVTLPPPNDGSSYLDKLSLHVSFQDKVVDLGTLSQILNTKSVDILVNEFSIESSMSFITSFFEDTEASKTISNIKTVFETNEVFSKIVKNLLLSFKVSLSLSPFSVQVEFINFTCNHLPLFNSSYLLEGKYSFTSSGKELLVKCTGDTRLTLSRIYEVLPFEESSTLNQFNCLNITLKEAGFKLLPSKVGWMKGTLELGSFQVRFGVFADSAKGQFGLLILGGDQADIFAVIGENLSFMKPVVGFLNISLCLNHVAFISKTEPHGGITLDNFPQSDREDWVVLVNTVGTGSGGERKNCFSASLSLGFKKSYFWDLLQLSEKSFVGSLTVESGQPPNLHIPLCSQAISICEIICFNKLDFTANSEKVELDCAFSLASARGPSAGFQFAGSFLYNIDERFFTGSFTLQGNDGGVIRLGDWVEMLDWIELYNISFSITVAESCCFSLSGGARFLVGEKPTTIEAALNYDPTNPAAQVFFGFTSVYLSCSNLAWLTFLSKLYCLPPSKHGAIRWVEAWLPQFEAIRFLVNVGDDTVKLPSLKSKEVIDPENKIERLFRDDEMKSKKVITAFQADVKWLGAKASMFFHLSIAKGISINPQRFLRTLLSEPTMAAEASLLIQPIKFSVLEIRGSKEKEDQPLECRFLIDTEKGELMFNLDAYIRFLCVGVEAKVSFTKGEKNGKKKQPRLCVCFEFEICGIILNMKLRVCFHKTHSKTFNKIKQLSGQLGSSTLEKLEQNLLIPRALKFNLLLCSEKEGEGVKTKFINALFDQVKKVKELLLEKTDEYVNILKDNKSGIISKGFACIGTILCAAGCILCSFIDAIGDLVKQLLEKLTEDLEIYSIRFDGDVSWGDVMVSLSYDIAIRQKKIVGSVHVRYESFITDLAKYIVCLFVGSHPQQSGSIGCSGKDTSDYYEGESSDEEDYPEPTHKITRARVDTQETLKFPNAPNGKQGQRGSGESLLPRAGIVEEGRNLSSSAKNHNSERKRTAEGEGFETPSPVEKKPRLQPQQVAPKQSIQKLSGGQKKQDEYDDEGEAVSNNSEDDSDEDSSCDNNEGNNQKKNLLELEERGKLQSNLNFIGEALRKAEREGKIKDPTPELMAKYPKMFINVITKAGPLTDTEKCNMCYQIIPRSKYQDHIFNCRKNTWSCPNCKKEFLFNNVITHLKTCAYKEEECKGCQFCHSKIPEANLKAHQETACLGETNCSNCKSTFPRRERAAHESQCRTEDNRWFCPFCTEVFPKETDPQAHFQECQSINYINCEQCGLLISKSEQAEHEKICLDVLVICEMCGQEVKRKDFVKHENDICPGKILVCDLCNEKISQSILLPNATVIERKIHHLETVCNSNYVNCPKCCGLEILRKNLFSHFTQCLKNKQKCTYPKCLREWVPRELQYELSFPECLLCGERTTDIVSHLKITCEKNLIKCNFCNTNILRKKLVEHYEACPQLHFPCMNKGCNQILYPKSQFEQVANHAVRCFIFNCVNGCGEFVKWEECKNEAITCNTLQKHHLACSENVRPCSYCNQKIFQSQEADHLFSECDKFTINCPKECGENFPLRLLDKHLMKCKLMMMKCIYSDCHDEFHLKALTNHLDNVCKSHKVACYLSAAKSRTINLGRFPCSRSYVKWQEDDHMKEFHYEHYTPTIPEGRATITDFHLEGLMNAIPLEQYYFIKNDTRLLQQLNRIAKKKALDGTMLAKYYEDDEWPCDLCGQPVCEENFIHHLNWECEGNMVDCGLGTCLWKQPRKELHKHRLQECSDCFVACSKCDKKILQREETAHIAFECTEMPNHICIFCMNRFYLKDYHTHACPRKTDRIPCPGSGNFFDTSTSGCGVTIERQHVLRHWMTECPNNIVICYFCKEHVKHKDFINHLFESCRESRFNCPNCSAKEIRPKNLFPHFLKDCPKFGANCSYCNDWICWKDTTKHLSECPKNKVKCLNGCSKELIILDLETHMINECDNFKFRCPKHDLGCKSTPLLSFIPHHLHHKCKFNRTKCQECHANDIPLYQKEKHDLDECNYRIVTCDKCQDTMPFIFSNDHPDYCKGKHPCPFNKDCGQFEGSALREHRKNCKYRLVKCHSDRCSALHPTTKDLPHSLEKPKHSSFSMSHPGTVKVNKKIKTKSVAVKKVVKVKGKDQVREKGFFATLGTCLTEWKSWSEAKQEIIPGELEDMEITEHEDRTYEKKTTKWSCCGRGPNSEGCKNLCERCQKQASATGCIQTCSACGALNPPSNEVCVKLCALCFQDVRKVPNCLFSKCPLCQEQATPGSGCALRTYVNLPEGVKRTKLWRDLTPKELAVELQKLKEKK